MIEKIDLSHKRGIYSVTVETSIACKCKVINCRQLKLKEKKIIKKELHGSYLFIIIIILLWTTYKYIEVPFQPLDI